MGSRMLLLFWLPLALGSRPSCPLLQFPRREMVLHLKMRCHLQLLFQLLVSLPWPYWPLPLSTSFSLLVFLIFLSICLSFFRFYFSFFCINLPFKSAFFSLMPLAVAPFADPPTLRSVVGIPGAAGAPPPPWGSWRSSSLVT